MIRSIMTSAFRICMSPEKRNPEINNIYFFSPNSFKTRAYTIHINFTVLYVCKQPCQIYFILGETFEIKLSMKTCQACLANFHQQYRS